MGYRPSLRETRRTADIRFAEDHEFHGAEVTVTLGASLGFWMEISRLGQMNAEEQAAVIRRFGDEFLVSWNVEDRHGEPITADGEGLVRQEIGLVLAIVEAFSAAVTGTSRPLGETSSAGGP